MTKADLVDLLANVITGLDNALTNDELLVDPPTWQLVYALRKHLDDQQRELLTAVLAEENAAYQASTATIQAAANGLNQVIAEIGQIDEIVAYVTQISADLDQVLKLVP